MMFKMSDINKKIWINSGLLFAILFFWILFLFQDNFLGMVTIWTRSETFTHGFLVPPIVIWLIWRKRNVLLSKQPKSNLLFLVPIIAISFVWLLGDLVSVNSVTQLAATAIVVLMVFALFGWSVASVIIFPLLFLFFAVPLGEFLLPLLMQWTAKFTVIAIRWSGIPVYQEGLQFVISTGSWSVVEACSGVRYLISSIMIGTLYAYLNYNSLNRRLIFICVSICVPVLANWMRAYFIVMLGHFSDNTLAVGFDHLIYGWLFFGIVIMLMFLIGGRWAESSSIDVAPFGIVSDGNISKISSFWYASLVIAIFVALPVAWIKFIADKPSIELLPLNAPIKFKSGWIASVDQSGTIRPDFHGYSADVNSIYTKNNLQIGFFVKNYINQNYENKLVSSDNSMFNSKNKSWIKLGDGRHLVNGTVDSFAVKTADWRGLGLPDQAVEVNLHMWQFYWVNGLFTSSDYMAKLYGAVQRLFGNGDNSAVVVLYAKNSVGNDAKKSIEEFFRDNYSEIKTMLQSTRVR